MKYLFFLLAAFALIISCNTGNKKSGLLQRPDDIKADEYVISTDRDTTLLTKNGALLKIPKGSLTTDKGNTVTLEIKEAYSLQQMIRAGLTTQSADGPLSSGGMIYINAAAGQNVTITKAIKVALPTDYLKDSMQLFKGEKDENGNIKWKDPVALPENKTLSTIQQGQVLFQDKCASCHAIGKDETGPDLAHFMKRFPVDLKDNEVSVDLNDNEASSGNGFYYDHAFYYIGEWEHWKGKGDTTHWYDIGNSISDRFNVYKCNLVHMFGSRGPQIFTDSANPELINIYRYIQNESDKKNLPLPGHAWLKDCTDSCYAYKKTVYDLQSKKEDARSKKEKLAKENGGLVEEKREPGPPVIGTITIPVGPPAPVNFEDRVSPNYYDAEYYQFTIETFGWYNIDCIMTRVDGVKESELFVRITGQYRQKIKIFLIIPSAKTYVEGGPAERNPEEFAFFLKNGKIPLPQNAKAYIMALTETEESIAFSLKEFTTTQKQEFDISLSQSTKDAFTSAINNLGFEKMNINVADAKNANEIRKTSTGIKNIEQELKKAEGLRPKNCDCDCGPVGPQSKTLVEKTK